MYVVYNVCFSSGLSKPVSSKLSIVTQLEYLLFKARHWILSHTSIKEKVFSVSPQTSDCPRF